VSCPETFVDDGECGDGKVPGLASTRPEKPNVCGDTNIAPLCSDDKNLNDTVEDTGRCTKTGEFPVCNNDVPTPPKFPAKPACTSDGTKFEAPKC
jgi:hypothetical protein